MCMKGNGYDNGSSHAVKLCGKIDLPTGPFGTALDEAIGWVKIRVAGTLREVSVFIRIDALFEMTCIA